MTATFKPALLAAGLLSCASLAGLPSAVSAAETQGANASGRVEPFQLAQREDDPRRQKQKEQQQQQQKQQKQGRGEQRQERGESRQPQRNERRDVRQDPRQQTRPPDQRQQQQVRPPEPRQQAQPPAAREERRGVRQEQQRPGSQNARDGRPPQPNEKRDGRQDQPQRPVVRPTDPRQGPQNARDGRPPQPSDSRDVRQEQQQRPGVRPDPRPGPKDARDARPPQPNEKRDARNTSKDGRDFRRMRLDDIKKERRERVEGGRRIIEEPDRRVIVREQGRAVIRHDEGDRFRRTFRDQRVERRKDGSTMTTYMRPGGIQVVSVVDSHGRLLHRYRRGPDGRMVVLIDNRRYHRPGVGGIFLGGYVALAPPIIRIPREKYIVDYEDSSYDDVYEALSAPPIEELERGYSLDEIRQSQYVRERVRRVDLDSVNFEFGSWEVPPEQYSRLERMARAINRVLERNPDAVFMVEGHTDAVGSDEDNLTLSDRRAESVAMILSDEFDVPPENLVTQGYGEQFLKIDTQAPEVINRRVAVRNISGLMSRAE